MKRLILLFTFVLSFFVFAVPAFAADQISYASQPDEVVVFLNNIAYARDTIALPGGVDVAVALPDQIFQDTLVLREDGERVPTYRINRNDGRIMLRWQSATDSEVREVTLEYLLSGLSWTPKYDMWLGDDEAETVELDFFAEITNSVLALDEVDIRLVAGRVDTSQQLDAVSTVTVNQYIAGYDRSGAGMAPTITGAASIQHIYTLDDTINAVPGDVVYVNMQESTLPARRVHLWNAQTDDQVTVIYKVRNESELPFAEGIVRSYQNGLFIGSDFVELTPIGGEGSITVGNLQDVRVSRAETRTAISGPYERDTQHDTVLTLTNFTGGSADIDIVDWYPAEALDFQFSLEPERQGGNIFRWEITLEAGETRTIMYQFKS